MTLSQVRQAAAASAADDQSPRLAASSPAVRPLMTIDEGAQYLGVSPRWVYDQVRAAELPAMLIARSWRVRAEAVEAFAASFEWRPNPTGKGRR
jgi:excisionase family DNA binding protein